MEKCVKTAINTNFSTPETYVAESEKRNFVYCKQTLGLVAPQDLDVSFLYFKYFKTTSAALHKILA